MSLSSCPAWPVTSEVRCQQRGHLSPRLLGRDTRQSLPSACTSQSGLAAQPKNRLPGCKVPTSPARQGRCPQLSEESNQEHVDSEDLRLARSTKENALDLVDLMLHFGLPNHASFLLTHAVQAERAHCGHC